jgi:hypothetical protein
MTGFNPISYAIYLHKTYKGKLRIHKVKYPKYTGNEPCAGLNIDYFYMTDEDNRDISKVNYSKKICRGCPLIVECFDWAIHHEAHGVWGGTTEFERRAIRRANNITMTDPVYTDYYLEHQDKFDRLQREKNGIN